MKFQILALLVASVFAAPPSKLRKTQDEDRIIGGTDVPPGELPYQLSYQDNGGHWCGASLIADTVAITAKHCLFGNWENPEGQWLLAGESDRRKEEGTEQKRAVSKIIAHPDDDIAILVTSSPFEYNEYVQKIDIPASKENFEGIGIASGWGYITTDRPLGPVLQKIEAPLYTDDECVDLWWGQNFKPWELCAGGVQGEGVCGGDSGGPLACSGYLCGVVSYGAPCALGIPDAYVKVSYFVDWIKANVEV